MKIIDILNSGRPGLSMEVFPPKTIDNYSKIEGAVNEIASLKPSFMSVTYGAGGGTSRFTASLAGSVQKKHGVPTLAHLTCVSSTKEQIGECLEKLKEEGIRNILALRGDILPDTDMSRLEYRYASQLIETIKEHGDFCIGGACYPESHPESESFTKDIENLKIKVDAGCSFLTTQMFFDNDILYNFMFKIRDAGINVPVVAGIMPVTNARQIKRIIGISGTMVPTRFRRIVDRYADDPAAMKQAGIAYACEQIIDLYANGINAVHLYTMNSPEVASKIMENISEIIK